MASRCVFRFFSSMTMKASHHANQNQSRRVSNTAFSRARLGLLQENIQTIKKRHTFKHIVKVQSIFYFFPDESSQHDLAILQQVKERRTPWCASLKGTSWWPSISVVFLARSFLSCLQALFVFRFTSSQPKPLTHKQSGCIQEHKYFEHIDLSVGHITHWSIVASIFWIKKHNIECLCLFECTTSVSAFSHLLAFDLSFKSELDSLA